MGKGFRIPAAVLLLSTATATWAQSSASFECIARGDMRDCARSVTEDLPVWGRHAADADASTGAHALAAGSAPGSWLEGLNPNGHPIRDGHGDPFVASPVPEPSTYALMLAGLGALGFLARRRRIG